MTIKDLTNRLKVERRDVTVQTSISESDSDTLDQLVEWFAEQGVNANRSGVLRAVLLDALEIFKKDYAKEADTDQGFSQPTGDVGDASGYLKP